MRHNGQKLPVKLVRVAAAAGLAVPFVPVAGDKVGEMFPGQQTPALEQAVNPAAEAASRQRTIVKTKTICIGAGTHLFSTRAAINNRAGDAGVTESQATVNAVVRGARNQRQDYYVRTAPGRQDLVKRWFTSLNIAGQEPNITNGPCSLRDSETGTRLRPDTPATQTFPKKLVRDVNEDGSAVFADVAALSTSCDIYSGGTPKATVEVTLNTNTSRRVTGLRLGFHDPTRYFPPFDLLTGNQAALPAWSDIANPALQRDKFNQISVRYGELTLPRFGDVVLSLTVINPSGGARFVHIGQRLDAESCSFASGNTGTNNQPPEFE